MSREHGIAWLNIPGYKGESWNPVTGCSKISDGCLNCYAERVSERFGLPWGEPVRHEERMTKPSHWKKPRAIFVCSMADLFHKGVPSQYIFEVRHQAWENPQHKFIFLTKRADRMSDLLNWGEWPENVLMGVSAEDQRFAALRLHDLFYAPVKIPKIISVEPMLGPVDLTNLVVGRDSMYGYDALRGCMHGQGPSDHGPNKLSWVICGGESGPRARPMDPDWARSLRDQCQEAGVPFFMKQMSQHGGSDRHAIPEDLKVREFPV